MRNCVMLTILFLCLTFLPQALVAHTRVSLDSLQHLQEVSVTARRNVTLVAPQRLSGDKLQRLNAHSVADAIRYFSGVQLKDYGGIGGLKTTNIRSLGTNHTGVFYDGIQLGNAQNGQIDLGKFSLDNMEEISLYNGQKCDIWQPARDFGTSASVYLRSRTPRFSSEEHYRLKIAMKTGSFGLANPSILWEQKVSERVGSLFNAEYTYATGRYKFRYFRTNPDGSTAYDTTAVRENGDINALRLEGGFYGKTRQSGEWNAKIYFYNSQRGIPGPILNNVWRHGERQWDRNFFTQGAYKENFGEHYHLLINTKYAYDYTEYLRDDPRELYIHNHYRQHEYFLSAAHLFNLFSWWNLSLSTDFQWNYMEADLHDFVYPSRYTELVALATSFQWERLQLQGSVLGAFIQDNTGNRREKTIDENRKNEFSPAIVVNYRPFARYDLHLRAWCKKSFRMPTFNDLYYTDVGNKYLKPERTIQYNGGVTYRKNWTSGFLRYIEIQGDAYYNVVTDKIIAYPSGRQFRWSMMNLGRVEIRGCDLAVQAAVRAGSCDIGVRGTYTFQHAEDYTDAKYRYYGHQIPYVPTHSISALLWGDWKRWSLNYSFIYTGERYSGSENSRKNRLQPWYTSDIGLARTFEIKNVSCKIAAEVNNIFNQHYDVVANYPMPGTNFKITMIVEI